MNSQELHEKLTAISKNPVKRWILETVIDLFLFRQWVREMFNGPKGGAA